MVPFAIASVLTDSVITTSAQHHIGAELSPTVFSEAHSALVTQEVSLLATVDVVGAVSLVNCHESKTVPVEDDWIKRGLDTYYSANPDGKHSL